MESGRRLKEKIEMEQKPNPSKEKKTEQRQKNETNHLITAFKFLRILSVFPFSILMRCIVTSLHRLTVTVIVWLLAPFLIQKGE